MIKRKRLKPESDKPSIFGKAYNSVRDKCYDLSVALSRKTGYDKRKKVSLSSKSVKDMIFYIIMLIFPIAHFLYFYFAVNINSFLLAFRSFDYDSLSYQWVGFQNFSNIYKEYCASSLLKDAFLNSLRVYAWGLLTGVPLGLLFSYYIAKKLFGHEFFKVMLFLPTILSSLVLVIMYKYVADRLYPAVVKILLGKNVEGLFTNTSTAFGTLLFYNILTSFGTNVLIYSSAMDRIPESIIESAKLEGISRFQEFRHITLPLIFPTLSTLLIVGVSGIFTNQFNLFSVYGIAVPNTNMYTLGYYLFAETAYANVSSYPRLSSFGILFTAMAVPLTFGVRFLLEKFGPKGAEF